MRFNPWRGIADLPRGMWILFAATLINRAGTMALPFLLLYLTQELDVAPAQAGLAMLIYGLGSVIAGPLSGWLCERLGPLRVIQASLVASGGLLLFFPLVQSFPLILATTLLWSVLGEAYRPASATLVSDLVPPHRRNAAFALYRLAANLGMSIGPLVGGLLASHVSYPSLFWVDGATSILAGLALAAARLTLPAPSEASPHIASSARSAWTDLKLLYFMAAITPVVMVFFQFEGALPLFMVRDLKLPESVYGSMFLVNTILIVLVEVPLNLATADWPHRRLLALGSLLVALGFGGLIFANGILGITATTAIWTFGEMILMPNSAAYVANLAPAHRRGSYMGAYHMISSLAFALGPWLGTLLFDQFGAPALWTIALSVGLLSAALLSRVATIPTS